MDRPYDSIPRQGSHAGGQHDEEPTTSVRAQPAPHPPETEPPATPTFGLYYNEQEDVYRIRSWQSEAPSDQENADAYRSLGTYDRIDALLTELPERDRFIVFENPETGEVYYDKEGNITGGLTGGQFMQVNVFRDETTAAAYAESRQRR